MGEEMADWTRQAAEQICREIFASVAYPDEALIERVRKVIEAQSHEMVEEAEARAASSKSAAESLAEDFNTMASELTMWRGKYETFCRERDEARAAAATARRDALLAARNAKCFLCAAHPDEALESIGGEGFHVLPGMKSRCQSLEIRALLDKESVGG